LSVVAKTYERILERRLRRREIEEQMTDSQSGFRKGHSIQDHVFTIKESIYRVPENGALPVHYGVEEITVNVRKMLKKFYLLIWRSLKLAFNRSIILKNMHEIVMTATSNGTYYISQSTRSLTTNIRSCIIENLEV
jgi:hypothetical protein